MLKRLLGGALQPSESRLNVCRVYVRVRHNAAAAYTAAPVRPSLHESISHVEELFIKHKLTSATHNWKNTNSSHQRAPQKQHEGNSRGIQQAEGGSSLVILCVSDLQRLAAHIILSAVSD